MEKSLALDVLKMFVGHDSLRPEMKTPFRQKDFYFATDAHRLVCLPVSVINLDLDEIEKPNCIGVMPNERTKPIEISTSFIDEIYTQLPMTDELKEVLGSCNECYGRGVVECNYGHDHECPECDGTGKAEVEEKKGKKVKDVDAYIRVWGIIYRYNHLKSVFAVAAKLGLESFSLIRGNQSRSNLFQIGVFQVLIMSQSYDYGYKITNIIDTETTQLKPYNS